MKLAWREPENGRCASNVRRTTGTPARSVAFVPLRQTSRSARFTCSRSSLTHQSPEQFSGTNIERRISRRAELVRARRVMQRSPPKAPQLGRIRRQARCSPEVARVPRNRLRAPGSRTANSLRGPILAPRNHRESVVRADFWSDSHPTRDETGTSEPPPRLLPKMRDSQPRDRANARACAAQPRSLRGGNPQEK